MKIFRSKFAKILAAFLAFNVMYQVAFPTVAWALTSGPTQPEVSSFKPIEASNMVELFTGDFSYNIPLMDVGGYPINLGYNAGAGVDEEASWVGLGWNINPGAINRSVRGVPDDFKGDFINKKFNVKPNRRFGISGGVGFEVFGFEGGEVLKKVGMTLGLSLGLGFSNYNGYQFELGAEPSLKFANTNKLDLEPRANFGISLNNESGIELEPSASFSKEINGISKGCDEISVKIGLPFNSRSGIKEISLGAGYALDQHYYEYQGLKLNGSGSISFITPTHSITPNSSMTNAGINLSFMTGVEAWGVDGHWKVSGYYTQSWVSESDKDKNYQAYGYLYEQFADNNSILDFNREKDGQYSEDRPYLPLTIHTHDIYSVAGQGISGSYRPFRNDVGVVHDAYYSNRSAPNPALGLGLSLGGLIKNSFDANVPWGSSEAGKWEEKNYAIEHLDFEGADEIGGNEIVFFKQAGEKVVGFDKERFNYYGGYSPIEVEVDRDKYGSKKGKALAKLKVNGEVKNLQSKRRTKKISRNQSISYLTAKDANEFALERGILSYRKNYFALGETGYLSESYRTRAAGVRQDHHISEITTLKPDGTRYVFGIPAYNRVQKDISFSVNKPSNADYEKGLVSYSGTDASVDNDIDPSEKFFEQKSTPPFAHSYLLSAVLSADYEDKNFDGPTPDDLGAYTKFNYTRVYDNYEWRAPFEAGKASHSEMLHSLDSDDKGNVVYGEKELWYLHSIETKTHVAEFILEDRNDGVSVAGVDGGIGSKKLQRLKEIRLFNREDRIKNGLSAVPIKVARFVYDYSLCPGISNSVNGGGKLTLKEVYFTFGNSKKGILSPYKFYYTENRGYDKNASDRWGNYKPDLEDGLRNAEFPYSVQDADTANRYASAWALNTIKLPSGGEIKVEYESDSYAYIQDKRAMRMFKVIGAGNSPNVNSASNILFEQRDFQANTYNNYLYFKLENPSDRIEDYIHGLKDTVMYYRFMVNVNANISEYVSGYTKLDEGGYGKCTDDPNYGFVKLQATDVRFKEKPSRSPDQNPISKAGWQFVRMHLPHIAYDQESPDDVNIGNPLDFVKSISSTFLQVQQLFTGINKYMQTNNLCNSFEIGKSWIRLYEPDGEKFGGGYRVKTVKISDKWNSMSSTDITKEYGQEYIYTTEENGRLISSGVASYEPMLGGDENPHRLPIFVSENKILAPGNDLYVEEPFGESFFPSASVGYSKVTVKDIIPDGGVVYGTGASVNEFYTARDYPTITKKTDSEPKRMKPKSLGNFLKYNYKDFTVASQGYVVILNDMHGKQKKVTVTDNSGAIISSVEYIYSKTKRGHLNNDAYLLSKSGELSKETIGVDYDIISDMRYSTSEANSAGAHVNIDLIPLLFVPMAVPAILPAWNHEETGFKSACITKVINQYAILEEVIANDMGSVVSTKNLLYDKETGEVLMTETINQNEQPVYNLTYPAHWAYERMGMAYKNNGVVLLNVSINNAKDLFTEGDELGISHPEGQVSFKLWVDSKNANSIKVIDKNGDEYTDKDVEMLKIAVLRSGRKNMQAVPIGSVTCMENPLKDSDGNGVYDDIDLLNFNKVLTASAVEYGSKWRLRCTCGTDFSETPYNPFLLGAKSKIKPIKTYAYLTERTQTYNNGKTNIKTDGVFKDFSPFWTPPADNDALWTRHKSRWQYAAEVTQYNPDGAELENKDALNRYSSALFGYRNMYNTAVANNARVKDIAFDGFEDYLGGECRDDHFSFRKYPDNVVDDESHSGSKSIRVGSGQELEIRKVIRSCD